MYIHLTSQKKGVIRLRMRALLERAVRPFPSRFVHPSHAAIASAHVPNTGNVPWACAFIPVLIIHVYTYSVEMSSVSGNLCDRLPKSLLLDQKSGVAKVRV